MARSVSCYMSKELKVEIKRIQSTFKRNFGVEVTEVEVTRLIAKKLKKSPIKLRKVGKGLKVL